MVLDSVRHTHFRESTILWYEPLKTENEKTNKTLSLGKFSTLQKTHVKISHN